MIHPGKKRKNTLAVVFRPGFAGRRPVAGPTALDGVFHSPQSWIFLAVRTAWRPLPALEGSEGGSGLAHPDSHGRNLDRKDFLLLYLAEVAGTPTGSRFFNPIRRFLDHPKSFGRRDIGGPIPFFPAETPFRSAQLGSSRKPPGPSPGKKLLKIQEKLDAQARNTKDQPASFQEMFGNKPIEAASGPVSPSEHNPAVFTEMNPLLN